MGAPPAYGKLSQEMGSAILIYLMGALVSPSTYAATGVWVWAGPEGGTVRSLPVDLAGTGFGGVLRSTDRGNTWKESNDVVYDVYALTIHRVTGAFSPVSFTTIS